MRWVMPPVPGSKELQMSKYDRELPNRHCPTCDRIPVKTKTWNKLTAQDELIKRLQLRVKELEEKLEKK